MTEVLASGDVVSLLGIQAMPGTRFRINDGGDMEIGLYGIYELDLVRIGGTVTSIKIQQVKNLPTESNNSKIIVDVLYESGGV
jgi:hypothetical protein